MTRYGDAGVADMALHIVGTEEATDPAGSGSWENVPGVGPVPRDEELAARLEPFDSYWQAPDNVEKGYASFATYYKANVLPHVPTDKSSAILIVSCGPGYLVNLLKEQGYTDVLGIESDPAKVEFARKRGLPCETARAFGFLIDKADAYDAIILEQELNHLTYDEMIPFLKLCRRALRSGGVIYAYGLNGANPMVGAENLAHNIDHFNTFAEHSLIQVLELGGFTDIRLLPMKLYVFWTNPLNYIGLAATTLLEFWYKAWFKLYGKNVKILSKKIAATGRKA